MADIKFGAAQVGNPTPSGLNLWVRVYTVVAGVFMAWMAMTNIMGPHTKDVVNQILGLLMGLTNGLAPLFGVQVSSKYVKAEDVSAIDEKKVP